MILYEVVLSFCCSNFFAKMSDSNSSSPSFDGQEDEKALLGEDTEWQRQPSKIGGKTLIPWLLVIVASTVMCLVGVGVGLYLGRNIVDPSVNRCVDHLTQASMFQY